LVNIESFKDIHKGERCFIIGTGPSINNTNLDSLQDEICFGVNTLYRGYDNLKLRCQYYAVSDPWVWQNHWQGISKLDTQLFIWKSIISMHTPICPYTALNTAPIPMWMSNRMSEDAAYNVGWGETVIIDVALQMAYYMGFSKVYLLGCDSTYEGKHRFDSDGSDVPTSNAIKGNWSHIFKSYQICKEAYETDGREIINCTVGGKLEIYKRQKLEDVLNE